MKIRTGTIDYVRYTSCYSVHVKIEPYMWTYTLLDSMVTEQNIGFLSWQMDRFLKKIKVKSYLDLCGLPIKISYDDNYLNILSFEILNKTFSDLIYFDD